ncbi:hypothetical protein BJX99DRAFT_236065 [Aspergillus californicus]
MTSQGESPNPAAPGAECSREILGPTIFFWMVCFAINSMTQPTGEVLGVSDSHPAMLRSSPIFCAFDAIDVMVSWTTSIFSSSTPTTVSVTATQILRRRIRDKDGNPDLHAIRTLKTQWLLRWVAFILGALPQFIKLFASKGILLSQILGAMYLASWCLFELLFLMAAVDDVALQQPLPLSIFSRHPLKQAWMIMALVCNGILYATPCAIAWVTIFVSALDSTNSNTRTVYLAFHLPVLFVAYLVLWWNLFPYVFRPRVATPDWGSSIALFDLNIPFGFLAEDGPFTQGTTGVALLPISVVLFIGLLPRWFQDGRLFGLTGVDMWRLRVLFSQPLIFYALIYDSAGTYQPDWLQYLG